MERSIDLKTLKELLQHFRAELGKIYTKINLLDKERQEYISDRLKLEDHIERIEKAIVNEK